MRVFPEWMDNLPMQQQSVLLLAARGPDGFTAVYEILRYDLAAAIKPQGDD